MPPLSEEAYPEYCAHRRECFPNWHRPYLLDFERTMRRADMALGGDGNLGLPYWDWLEPEINGEVMPAVVREHLLDEFPPDFFPTPPAPSRHNYRLGGGRSDAAIKAQLERSNVRQLALACLHSAAYRQHASTAFASARHPSLEASHNTIHGIVGGVMASFQSSFHPIFWMHHNNVERLFESYLRLHPDSHEEFRRHQRTRAPNGQRGFPDGPYGRYVPFTNSRTGAPFHARDSFASPAELGFEFDALVPAPPRQQREAPYLAAFEGVDVRKVAHPRCVYCFVSPKGGEFTPPPPDASVEEVTAQPTFAGMSGIFFLDTPSGCDNCKDNPMFDLHVDVTAALRAQRLGPGDAVLHAVIDSDDGLVPLTANGPVPLPTLRGPRFAAGDSAAVTPSSSVYDIEALQQLLQSCGFETPTDGTMSDATTQAITAFQREAGLPVTGRAGPETTRQLLRTLHGDEQQPLPEGAPAPYAAHSEVTYYVDVDTLPESLIARESALVADLATAFATWTAPTQIAFVRTARREEAQLTIGFSDLTASNAFAFDGPGGKLAQASPSTITFDAAENWTLSGDPLAPPAEDFWAAQTFSLLAIATHEIGHVLGLRHSHSPADVMSPYYSARQRLSPADVARVQALVGT